MITVTSVDPDPIAAAAHWLAAGGADRAQAVLPQLRERFGLSPLQAIQAEREAAWIQARAD